MTPARAQLEGVVDALRRRQQLAIAITALVEMMLIAACAYALLRLGMPNLVLSKPRRIALALGMVLVFFAALLFENQRQSRSVLFLAKRIDVENALEDHLSTALSFPDPVMSPYEQACMNALIIRLQSQQLRLPEVRLERLWLVAPALLVTAFTGAVDLRRRVRPTDDGRAKIVLTDLDRAAIDRQLKPALVDLGKLDPATQKQMQDVADQIKRIVDNQATKESALGALSTARQQLADMEVASPSLVSAALQLGDPSSQRAQQFMNAMRNGDASGVSKALDAFKRSLEGTLPPPLTAEERAEMSQILKELGDVANRDPLKTQLADASAALKDPARSADAAKTFDDLKGTLPEQVSRELAKNALIKALQGAAAMTARRVDLVARKSGEAPPVAGGGVASDGGVSDTIGMADGDDGDESGKTQGSGDSPLGGNGAGDATSPAYKGGTAEKPTSNVDQRITSPWVNAPIRQTVAAGQAGDTSATTAAKQILQVQERAAEQGVRREEIPAEYAQAIHRYFMNVRRDLERK